jgi:hypothetical protein
MKSIISIAAILALATSLLTGCNQNNSSDSTNPAATNSSPAVATGMMDGNTNLPATNNITDLNTNKPTGTNQ